MHLSAIAQGLTNKKITFWVTLVLSFITIAPGFFNKIMKALEHGMPHTSPTCAEETVHEDCIITHKVVY